MPSTTVRRDDVLALAAVAGAVALATLPGLYRGMNWSDTGQIFHFGHRMLNGEFPYRNFAYQSGFLGILVDSWYQALFGATYQVSLAARFTIQLLTVISMYAMVRAFSHPWIAAAVASGMALITPVFFNEVLHGGGNNNYSNLMLIAGLAFLMHGLPGGHRREGSPWKVFAAGLALAGILSARQSNGILALATSVGAAAVLAGRDPRSWLRPFAIPLAGGIATGLAISIGFLAAHGALTNAANELFIHAGEKKNISALSGLINMLSGGLGPRATGAHVRDLIVLPLGLATATLLAAVGPLARRVPGPRGFGMLLLPIAVGLGLVLFVMPAARPFALVLTNEFPRTLFTLVAAIAVFAPRRTEAITGIRHPVLLWMCALALATVWARKLSFFGQHDAPYDILVLVGVVLPLASATVSARARRTVALAFLAIALATFGHHAASGRLGTSDGNVTDARSPLVHPMTEGVLVTREKATALAELLREVRPGDSLFIYGSAAPLYTLLQCTNPTRLDVTFSDAFTEEQAEEAIRALRENPPTWIIEAANLHTAYIGRDFDGSPDFYGPHAQAGPRVLHEGLVSMRRRYRQVFAVHQRLDQPPVGYEWEDWDDIVNLRLHRRRD